MSIYYTRLYARAILLEEYRNGTTVEGAIEKVKAELRPNAIDGNNARYWFKAFKDGYEKIANTADDADRRLVENGTFLRSKRSLLSGPSSLRIPVMCKTYGIESRFQIFYEYDCLTNWIVDTFNGTKERIKIDFSAVTKPYMHALGLEIMCFIGPSTVCGVVDSKSEGRSWFKGNIDADFDLRIETIKYLSGMLPTLDTQTQPATLRYQLDTRLFSYMVDLDNGNLSELNVINMHYEIWSPILRNGKLFGFPVDNRTRINTKKLFEISLIDGSKIEHEVEDKSNMEIRDKQCDSLWADGKLLVGAFDYSNKMSTVHKFDISQMKWEKTKVEVKGRIKSMSLTDAVLHIHAENQDNDSRQLYRFQYDTVDSLANLVWLSMRRYSNWNPSFYEWFMSKLPKNHKLRPLWINRKRKHD
ncbi:hypothetical protein M3Y94_00307600 [Aphelenchoides besseyi]|nr:hypothetical protein M3Y94_00307600 [Aphelenchoides besseyi]KAI6235768.1 hypothetical protein M3Y95_00086300 [Aphelenchoides besseyi]